MYKKLFSLLFIFLLLSAAGCKKEPQPIPEEEYGKPEPVFQVIPEDINNADSYDQPRIQFVWQGPNREKPEIWSIKIDGTDLRLAADKDLLYQGKTRDMEILANPVRSPDNRYILMQYLKFGYPDRVQLIDLKNHTNKYLTDCQIWRAPWVGDGQSFFCKSYHKLVRYYIHNNEKKDVDLSTGSPFYVLQNSERIVQMEEDGFKILDFNGREIRYEKLGEIMPTQHTVSKNGKYIMYKPKNQFDVKKRYKVAKLKSPLEIISEFKGVDAISERINKVVFGISWQIATINIDGTEKKIIYSKKNVNALSKKDGYSFGRFTLYNDK